MSETAYDIVIIGGGPSGLTAALYAARSRVKTLLLERMGCGGQSAITDWIENYPGFPEGTNGFELAAKFEEQARKFGLEVRYEDVTGLSVAGSSVAVATSAETYAVPAVIIASGANWRTLNVPGELPLRGKGVSYCATCDGPFFKGKEIVVVGGGNSAVQEAIYLTRFASHVTLVHRRDRLRATPILAERLLANPAITVRWNSTVQAIEGNESVEAVRLKDVVTGVEDVLRTAGVFIFAGLTPNTGFLKGVLTLSEGGYIVTDAEMRTSAPGVFACGDVRDKMLRQVITAAGDGATAAFAAQQYIEELRGTSYR